MKITKNENGSIRIKAENDDENQAVIVISELAVLAYDNGDLSEDDVNGHGCGWCTIPGMDWVCRIINGGGRDDD